MIHRAIGRLAVIALTGTFIFAAGPAFAACSGDKCETGNSAVSKTHPKKGRVAHRRQNDGDDIASGDRASDRDAAKNQAKAETKPNALPTDVADARAQMTSH